MRASTTLCQPIGDARSKQSLRFAADENTHVATRQSQLGIIRRADFTVQSLRSRGRDDVVLLRIDIQDRTGDFSQFDNTAAKLEAAFDSFL
jgi:hypothetical protein